MLVHIVADYGHGDLAFAAVGEPAEAPQDQLGEAQQERPVAPQTKDALSPAYAVAPRAAWRVSATSCTRTAGKRAAAGGAAPAGAKRARRPRSATKRTDAKRNPPE